VGAVGITRDRLSLCPGWLGKLVTIDEPAHLPQLTGNCPLRSTATEILAESVAWAAFSACSNQLEVE